MSDRRPSKRISLWPAGRAPSRKNPPHASRILLPGLLIALAPFASGCGDSRRPTGDGPTPSSQFAGGATTSESGAPARAANKEELALIAPVAAGQTLEGFDVVDVRGVTDGGLDVVLRKGSARIVLTVALLGKGGPEPPASTDRYAVFYSLRGAEPADGERAAKALANVLGTHRDSPPPPGMGPFVPRPLSL
ncbi:MAG: hypothetical protein U0441_12230 [Polyangiaceae bacterium]